MKKTSSKAAAKHNAAKVAARVASAALFPFYQERVFTFIYPMVGQVPLVSETLLGSQHNFEMQQEMFSCGDTYNPVQMLSSFLPSTFNH